MRVCSRWKFGGSVGVDDPALPTGPLFGTDRGPVPHGKLGFGDALLWKGLGRINKSWGRCVKMSSGVHP
jgi:hypothetical protein